MLRPLLAALALALALGLAPAGARPGQPAQLPARLYLPVISQPAGLPATVRFGTGLDGETLSGAGTVFPAGLTTLYYEVAVEGGAGLPFRLEWTVAGARRPELDREGLLPAGGAPFTGGIALSTAAPLPTGAYQLRVFVAGLSSGAGQASIQ